MIRISFFVWILCFSFPAFAETLNENAAYKTAAVQKLGMTGESVPVRTAPKIKRTPKPYLPRAEKRFQPSSEQERDSEKKEIKRRSERNQ